MMNIVAPGKMILLGEYAVLDDAPALVCAVDRLAIVSMKPLAGQEFRFSAPSLGLFDLPFVVTPKGHVRFDPSREAALASRLKLFSKIFEFALNRLDVSYSHGWFVGINTDDFYSQALHTKLGFGSSAALCVALVTAMNQAFQTGLSDEALFRLALDAHHHAQGKVGSGIDIAASFYGGYLIYRRIRRDDPLTKRPENVAPCPGLFFKAVFTGKSASTAHMVRGVNQLKETHADVYREIMGRLKEISLQGSEHFKNGNVHGFLQNVTEFYHALKELGDRSGMPIISPVHEKLGALASQERVAYKPSGAGGGDIGILFSDDPERLEATAQKAHQAGFHPLDLSIDTHGKRILTD